MTDDELRAEFQSIRGEFKSVNNRLDALVTRAGKSEHDNRERFDALDAPIDGLHIAIDGRFDDLAGARCGATCP